MQHSDEKRFATQQFQKRNNMYLLQDTTCQLCDSRATLCSKEIILFTLARHYFVLDKKKIFIWASLYILSQIIIAVI